MKNDKLFQEAYEQAIYMLETGAKTGDILSYLTTAAEIASGSDCVASILVLDDSGLLRNGASPRLPEDYLAAIDGLKPDKMVGTCAAAAATGNMVMTPDFYADNKWAELRHLPLALGFVGAWSMPIRVKNGKVLGTFGTYYREKKKPSFEEVEGIRLLASAAARVLTK